MSQRLLLCTDLDRTLLPNGPEPESVDALRIFRDLIARPEVSLAYVTGRDRGRVEDAMEQYQLPVPDYVIADVGTTVYEISAADAWTRNLRWEKEIGCDWANYDHDSLARQLTDLPELSLQEASRQNRYKLSYYVSLTAEMTTLTAAVRSRLDGIGVGHTLIYSVDDLRGLGLLDIVPAGASKLHAIEFIMREAGFGRSDTVFCGDSGNDLNVLASDIQGVLVANATAEVRREAVSLARRHGNEDALYIARGSFMHLNGNYAAGILEGVAHFCPAARAWMSVSLAEVDEP